MSNYFYEYILTILNANKVNKIVSEKVAKQILSTIEELEVNIKNTPIISKKRLYKIWYGMKYRCSSNKHSRYRHYGGRGISVCEEWVNNYSAFELWALKNGYRNSLTLDRINNNGNYEPSNCRWVTIIVQAKNKRNPCGKRKNITGFGGSAFEYINTGKPTATKLVL